MATSKVTSRIIHLQATGLLSLSRPPRGTALSLSRRLHTKPPQQILAQNLPLESAHVTESTRPSDSSSPSRRPSLSSTSHLSFLALLQTYLITACTSSPYIIGPSIRVLSAIAYSKSALLSPDRNSILNWLLKHTIYRQFCAGENATEVQATINRLRSSGIKRILLGYAREVEVRGENAATVSVSNGEAAAVHEIEAWAQGTLETIRMVPEDNFVSIKFSGAGAIALSHLKDNLSPPPFLAQRLHEICSLAYSRGIKLCIDAEQSTFQAGIDKWALDLAREFNSQPRPTDGLSSSEPLDVKPWACIHNTYQAYLQSTPSTLSSHLALASRESFTLGVKLVRGAYLGSEPRSLFWPTKEETDSCYDRLAAGLISKDWHEIRRAVTAAKLDATASKNGTPYLNGDGRSLQFPEIDLVLATHNLASVRKALSLQQQQNPGKYPDGIDITYAQLQGMADHVTGELVSAAATVSTTTSSASSEQGSLSDTSPVVPIVGKYLVWGRVSECSKYLVRRAEENRDAVARTVDARRALGKEVWRRVRAAVGLAG